MRGRVVGVAALMGGAIVGLGALMWGAFSGPAGGKVKAERGPGASERTHAAAGSKPAGSRPAPGSAAGEPTGAPEGTAPRAVGSADDRAPGSAPGAAAPRAGGPAAPLASGGAPSAGPGAVPRDPANGGVFPSPAANGRLSLDGGVLGALLGGAAVPPPPDAGPTACPSDMVDVGSFCIDATEATNTGYALFLYANFPPRRQPAMCAFNTDFDPKDPVTRKPAGTPPADNRPVIGVNWCDAWAYCAWSGKRLCGRIGGGPNPPAAFKDPAQSEWYNACSNNGASQFSYGDAFDASRCARPADDGTPAPAGSAPTCIGTTPPYDAIFDLSGSDGEWEDSCTGLTGGDDLCRTRGGGAAAVDGGGPAPFGGCGSEPLYRRHQIFANVGIRCCATRKTGQP